MQLTNLFKTLKHSSWPDCSTARISLPCLSGLAAHTQVPCGLVARTGVGALPCLLGLAADTKVPCGLVARTGVGALPCLLGLAADTQVPCGLVARIRGSHPRGPGSIPGTGRCFCRFNTRHARHLRCQCNELRTFSHSHQEYFSDRTFECILLVLQ